MRSDKKNDKSKSTDNKEKKKKVSIFRTVLITFMGLRGP